MPQREEERSRLDWGKSCRTEYLLQQKEIKRKTGRSKETEKRRIAPTERNKITKIKISGGKSTWIL